MKNKNTSFLNENSISEEVSEFFSNYNYPFSPFTQEDEEFVTKEILFQKIRKMAKEKLRKIEFIERHKIGHSHPTLRDRDKIGNLHFIQFGNYLINYEVKEAYKELLEGFNEVGCECTLFKIIERYKLKIELSLSVISNISNSYELDLIKSIFYFHIEDFESAYVHIKKYNIHKQKTEIGHYLKGRILLVKGRAREALKELEYALKINPTSRGYYRIGRVKQEILNQFGGDYFLQSVLLNPSCICAQRWLHISSKSHNIKLKSSNYNFLVDVFNNQNCNIYSHILLLFYQKEFVMFNCGYSLSSIDVIPEFYYTLIKEKKKFKLKNISTILEDTI